MLGRIEANPIYCAKGQSVDLFLEIGVELLSLGEETRLPRSFGEALALQSALGF